MLSMAYFARCFVIIIIHSSICKEMELSELVLTFQHLAAELLSIVLETIAIAKVLLSTKQ